MAVWLCVSVAGMMAGGGVAYGQTLDGATLSGSVVVPNGTTTTAYNDLTLDDANVEVRGVLEFLGVNTIGGVGRIELHESGDIRYNRSSSSFLVPGHRLTIGSGVEIVGLRDGGPGGPSIGYNTSNLNNPDRLINFGTLAAEGDPADLNSDLLIIPLIFENHGLVTARTGGGMRLYMREGWQNLGTYRAEDGGVFDLGGTIDPSKLGTLERLGTGRFALSGTVENAGKTFTLDDATGSMQLHASNVTINGGRVLGLDGTKLLGERTGLTLSSLFLNGGVVLDVDVDIRSTSADVTVTGGLTVNRTFFFDGDELRFVGAGPVVGSTLAGTGVLELHDGLRFADPLTIAAGMTVRGGSFSADIDSTTGDTLINHGTLEVLQGDQLAVRSALSQQGLIRAVGSGQITLSGNTDNTGQIQATDGGSIRFNAGTQRGSAEATGGGLFRFFGGVNAATGVVRATDGGIVQVSTALQNDGVIEVDGGFLWLENGTIGGNAAVVTDSTVILSGTLDSDALPDVPRTDSGWGLYGGTLNNAGRTMALTADRNTQWTLFGGRVTGGVIDSPDGTPLRLGTFFSAAGGVELDAVAVRTQTVLGATHALTAINGAAFTGGVVFDGGGLLVIDQPMAFTDVPVMTGQHGTLRLLDDLDMGGGAWLLPAALDTLELGRFSQGGEQVVSVELANGRVAGGPTQRLVVPGRVGATSAVLRDLTLAVDLNLTDIYSKAQVMGDVTLDGATITVLAGSSASTVSSLSRHGELQLGPGGRLLGQGTIRFLGNGFGGFTTLDSELVITSGVTVVGGDGRGLIGTDTGSTRNEGTLRAEARDDGLAALRIAGLGLENVGVIAVETGGWIEVSGSAALAGTLDVTLRAGEVFEVGDTFVALTADSVAGAFGAAALPIFDARTFAIQYGPDHVVLEVIALLAGDANNDGVVDAADFLAVEHNFGQLGVNNGSLLGDANDDGRVDGSDWLFVERRLGAVWEEPPPTPEPTSGGTALLLLVAALLGRRPRPTPRFPAGCAGRASCGGGSCPRPCR